MEKEHFILLFSSLGDYLRKWISGEIKDSVLDQAVEEDCSENPFFTPHFQKFSIASICDKFLKEEKIRYWLNGYDFSEEVQKQTRKKKIVLITAGNIPLVGFHDLMCTTLTGAEIYLKHSSKASHLFPAIISLLCNLDKSRTLGKRIHIIDRATLETLPFSPDLLIMTGNDKNGMIVHQRYKNTPSLIRGSRISVGVLSGKELRDDFSRLADDITTYFGLGCRSISHLLVPQGFDLTALKALIADKMAMSEENVFNSIYLKNRAFYTLSSIDFIDCKPFILVQKEDPFNSPGVVSWSSYKNKMERDLFLERFDSAIQKIYYNFGEAQGPELTDYPDKSDTLLFLYS